MTLKDHKRCLFGEESFQRYRDNISMILYNYSINTIKTYKLTYNSYGDKQYILYDRISTLTYELFRIEWIKHFIYLNASTNFIYLFLANWWKPTWWKLNNCLTINVFLKFKYVLVVCHYNVFKHNVYAYLIIDVIKITFFLP